MHMQFQQDAFHSALDVCVIAVAHAQVVTFQISNGRNFNMSASTIDYMKLFGNIASDEAFAMPRCACVACNSCTCACSCRIAPDRGEIEW